MHKSFTRVIALLALSTIFIIAAAATAAAQTVTIGTVNAGPYTPGSSIAVPVHVDYSSGCVAQTNVFNLYISDASGSFTSKTLIGTYKGFYTSYINGTLPTSLSAGTGYKVRVETTNPVTVTSPSSAFSVVAGSSLTPTLTGQLISTTYPNVFGVCNGAAGNSFSFGNSTTPSSAVVTASFFNESSQSIEATTTFTSSGGYTFIAQATNYTIIVTATNNGTVATKAYLLLNNSVSNAIGSSGNNSVCLSEGKGTIVFTVVPSSVASNYPGNTYLLSFGDGSSVTLTQCDILQSNGQIAHTYTSSSCGLQNDQAQNAFKIQLQSQDPFCGAVGTAVNTSAKVFEAPYNRISAPASACTNSTVTFLNKSYPGQNPNYTGSSCLNSAAQYTWSVDGTPQLFNANINTKFTYTFTTPGKHVIKLDLQSGSTVCSAATISDTICVANAPQPAFSLPARACMSSPVTPTDQSVVDNTCAISSYTWTVTGTGSVTYAGGTSKTSTQPQFVFSKPGVYVVGLSINSAGCGAISSKSDTLIVDATPVTKLSADTSLCGSNQILNFGAGTGPTQTILTGSGQATANTYLWTVSGGSYSFANGTTANSQYPQISFTDNNTYTISITQTNACGTSSATQHIKFQPSPTVYAGADQHICYGTQAALKGSITGGTVNNYQWMGGTGTFSDVHSLTPNYTPSAAELAAGQVTLALEATTNLPSPCNNIISNVTLFISPQVTITSAATGNTCSGNAFKYTITSNDATSTFTWTASVTSGSASGFTANGSGNTINDVINATGSTNAVVTYVITPTSSSGCSGLPSTLTVTVSPLPVLNAFAVNSAICSSQPVNINLNSNVTGTTYTWTSTVTGSITGNSNQATPISSNIITDVLINTGTTQGSATYIITPYNNGTCAGTPVTVTVTVQPLPVNANAGQNAAICSVTSYKLSGNDPSPGTGQWSVASGQTGITFSDASKPNAVVNGLVPGNTYKFVWSISSAPTCDPSTDTVTIVVQKDVLPSFTMSPKSGCGPTQVNFTNTSTNTTAASFLWDFGDGTTSTDINPIHTFQPVTSGKDVTYHVTLSIVNNCSVHAPYLDSVTVSPTTPTASVLAGSLTGCAPFAITAQNSSPGNNKEYDYYLYDGATLIQKIVKTDKSNAVFTAVSPKTTKTYTLYMVAINNCGTSAESKHIPVIISPPDLTPQFIVENNITTGCAPLSVNLINNSAGGNEFYYSVYDANGNRIAKLIAGTENFPYVFTSPGDYSITLTASDDCVPAGVESPKTSFHIYAVPAPAFKANTLKGCKTLTVTFTNTTPADATGTPASSLNYQWQFGDGTTSAEYQPLAHTYTKPGTYTVTLTASNSATTCSTTTTSTNYITVTAPLDVAFDIQPDSVINVPSYKFNFTDETTGGTPTEWLWDFGDGSTSTSSNPSHTYADTGRYTVTLTAADGTGCPGTIVHHVRITGVPGELYVPNAFMPGSSTAELQTFKAKGSGIKAYHLQIFNNWGQLVWESTELDSNGSPKEGWDGTFKGAPMPQGVYIWQMSATFINGTEWNGMTYNNSTPKRTGPIHLMR